MGHTRGMEVCLPYQKAVPLMVTIGDKTLQAFANLDDVEALRRALPRLTTPTEDTL